MYCTIGNLFQKLICVGGLIIKSVEILYNSSMKTGLMLQHSLHDYYIYQKQRIYVSIEQFLVMMHCSGEQSTKLYPHSSLSSWKMTMSSSPSVIHADARYS
jgi:uncharacterized protein (DUF1919 family)